MSAIGEVIKEKRKERHMSQNQLAKKAGIAQATLSAIESSTKSPAVDTVEKISAALECPVSELLGEEREGALPLTNRQLELLQIYLQLNQEARDQLMDYANYLLSRHEHKKEKDLAI